MDAANAILRIDKFLYVLFCLKVCLMSRSKWSSRRWLWAIRGLEIESLLAHWAVDLSANRSIRVIIFNAGGVGDLIQSTPILAAMRTKLPDAQIIFLHRSPMVKAVLAKNPHVDAVAFASFSCAKKLRTAIMHEGVADFMLELESGSYVGKYSLAPAVLRSNQLSQYMTEDFFEQATSVLEKRLKKHDFVQKDGIYCWPQAWKASSFLDTIGATTGLPVNRHSAFYFKLKPEDITFAAGIVQNRKVVTIQTGVDDAVVKWSLVTKRPASKLMPLSIWCEVVSQLKDKGYTVIQLGTKEDSVIDGVSIDMRGQTTLYQAGALIHSAVCHVGTEGGLIHLARAVGTRSVVLFGPTSVDFFGYDENVNLTAGTCNSCWQSSRDWYIYCPRGFFQPPCMAAHKANDIIGAVERLIK